MKKLSLALLILSTFSAIAQAESSVTMYGRIDLGLAKANNLALQEKANHPSYIGFKGMEDLGSGLSANFWLETGLEADTGSATAANFWNRDAAVGLVGEFGTVKLGTVKALLKSTEARVDPFSAEGAIGNDYNKYLLRAGNKIGQSRVSNAVTYISSNVAGFVFSGQAILSETNGVGSGMSLLTTYDNGPYSAQIGYEKPVVASTVPARPSMYSIGGGYKLGSDLKFTGVYTHGDTRTTTLASATGGVLKGFLVGATYRVGGGDAKAVFVQQRNAVYNTLQEVGLGYDYGMSKRTTLYGYAGTGRNRFTDATFKSTSHYQVGITHYF